MVESDNLVLEHLRAIRGEMAKMGDWMHTATAELTAIRQHLAGVVTIQEHDHGDIAGIKVRLERILRSGSIWSTNDLAVNLVGALRPA